MLRIAVMLGALTLAPTLAQAQNQPAGYRCPASGTILERTRGDTISYRGDAQAPFVCATSTGVQRFLGYWSTGDAFYRTGRADLERMMTAAVAGGSPAPVRIPYFSHSAVGYIPISVMETWTTRGTEQVTTPAGTFDALRVERVFQIQDSVYRYTQVLWLDRRSRAPIRVEVDHLNGVMAATIFSWQAAALNTTNVVSNR